MADEPGSAGAGNPGAGAPGAGAPPAGTAGSVDFSTYIPADIKDHPSLKTHDFKTPDGVGKLIRSYVSAQSMIGGDKVVVPKGANDNPEVWGKVYDALGRPKDPDSYQFGKDYKAPADPAAREIEGKFRKFAHDNGLNQKQFAELHGFLNSISSESQQRAVAAYQAKHEKAVETLKGEWGDKFDERVAVANKVLKAFGGSPEEVKAFTTRFANDPVVIRVLAEVGRRMDESALVGGDKPDFDLGPADAKSKRADIMTNKQNPLWSAFHNLDENGNKIRHPRHKEAMDEVARLSRISVGKDEVIYQ